MEGVIRIPAVTPVIVGGEVDAFYRVGQGGGLIPRAHANGDFFSVVRINFQTTHISVNITEFPVHRLPLLVQQARAHH